jgi:ribosome-associated translation inhibitor RaiA/cold shock CspA family protein
MNLPLQITFRNLDRSEAVADLIGKHAARLETYCPHITSCRVAVESLHHHHHRGHHFQVRIDVTVPGQELAASQEADEHHAYTDINVAVGDAFDSMRRQLEEYSSRRQGKVKAHDTPVHGAIFELFPDSDYGRIKTSDGELVYFHRNSVVDTDFDQLAVGDELRFSEEIGEKGPQASTVHRVGKHHFVDR